MTKIIPIEELIIQEVAARELPKDIEERVQVYWNELTAKYPGMFNGRYILESIWKMMTAQSR